MMENNSNDGFWAICDTDYGETISAGYPAEIDALRMLNGRGYGHVRFVPWGKTLSDIDRDKGGL